MSYRLGVAGGTVTVASGPGEIHIHAVCDLRIAPAKKTGLMDPVETQALVGAGRAKTERKHAI